MQSLESSGLCTHGNEYGRSRAPSTEQHIANKQAMTWPALGCRDRMPQTSDYSCTMRNNDDTAARDHNTATSAGCTPNTRMVGLPARTPAPVRAARQSGSIQAPPANVTPHKARRRHQRPMHKLEARGQPPGSGAGGAVRAPSCGRGPRSERASGAHTRNAAALAIAWLQAGRLQLRLQRRLQRRRPRPAGPAAAAAPRPTRAGPRAAAPSSAG